MVDEFWLSDPQWARLAPLLPNKPRGVPHFDDAGRVKYGMHAFRHFFASWAIQSKEHGRLGFPMKRAQFVLGHATFALTADTYSHLLPENNDDWSIMAAAEKSIIGAKYITLVVCATYMRHERWKTAPMEHRSLEHRHKNHFKPTCKWWCPGRDSNPHSRWETDFKSVASTDSATRAQPGA